MLFRVIVIVLLVMLMAAPVFARDNDGRDDDCSQATLKGLYVFAASGFATPPGATPVPKAIVELIRFNGDGTVTTPAVSLRVDTQAITFASPGAPGTYTVADLVPPDGACLGTLAFHDMLGNTFNLVIPRDGAKTIWLIQTNFNAPANVVGNVFQGTAVKIAH